MFIWFHFGIFILNLKSHWCVQDAMKKKVCCIHCNAKWYLKSPLHISSNVMNEIFFSLFLSICIFICVNKLLWLYWCICFVCWYLFEDALVPVCWQADWGVSWMLCIFWCAYASSFFFFRVCKIKGKTWHSRDTKSQNA